MVHNTDLQTVNCWTHAYLIPAQIMIVITDTCTIKLLTTEISVNARNAWIRKVLGKGLDIQL